VNVYVGVEILHGFRNLSNSEFWRIRNLKFEFEIVNFYTPEARHRKNYIDEFQEIDSKFEHNFYTPEARHRKNYIDEFQEIDSKFEHALIPHKVL